MALFLRLEARVAAPLMPLGLFRSRNVATSNVAGVLWAASMFAWFFISALYLQLVLGYSAMQVGLAFLPANLIMAALSLGVVRADRHAFRIPAAAGRGPGHCRGRAWPCSRARRWTAASSRTCFRACCCSAWARASPSTRC